MKILIVEDDVEKARHISAVLAGIAEIDIPRDVEHVADVTSAKRALATAHFDLLILDIVLPNRIDRAAERDAGLVLLDEILERPGYHVPAHVIGLTGYPDVVAAGSERFSRRLLTLLEYDPSSNAWEKQLEARVRHILLSAADTDGGDVGFHTDLAIVCALEAPELAHVLRLPWDWDQVSAPGDYTIYYRGAFLRNGERKVAIAAAAARMGMPAAAALTMKMIAAFRPRYVATCGITAGVRSRIGMGDILAADPSWDWGCGKWSEKEGEIIFEGAPHQVGLATQVRYRLTRFAADATKLNQIRQSWPGEKPENELRLRVGPQASGAAVLADGVTLQRVLMQHRQLLGVDMETYGVFAAADEAPLPRPIPFSLKSVVDFADSAKDDRFREYAAYTSAAALAYVAETLLD